MIYIYIYIIYNILYDIHIIPHIYCSFIYIIYISYGTEHYISTFSDIQPHGLQPEVSCKQGTGGARAKENLGEKDNQTAENDSKCDLVWLNVT